VVFLRINNHLYPPRMILQDEPYFFALLSCHSLLI
jgi:hypothetical protein